METANAIVTLGAGLDSVGRLNRESVARVSTAVHLFETGVAPYIIMAGGASYRRPTLDQPMPAEVMREEAIELGVHEDMVLTESRSRNTIGNACFTKREITEPQGWRNLALVTDLSHLPRSERIFNHVMGPEYEITGYSAGLPLGRRRLVHEAIGNVLVNTVFHGTEAGDDDTIQDRLFSLVPGYGELSPQQILANHVRNLVGRPISQPE